METQLLEISKTIERMESDLSFDRSKIEEILNKLSTIESRVKNIEDRQPRFENKVSDAVQDGLKPLVDTVQQVRKTKNKSLLKVLQLWSKGVKKNG